MMNRITRYILKFRASRLGVIFLGTFNIEGLFPSFTVNGKITVGENAVFMCKQGPRIVLQAHEGAVLSIGPSAFVNQSTTIIATTVVKIGANVKIGPHVVIHDTAYHEVDQGAGTRSAPITIGDNVWIGRSSTILPGVEIGDHSVIGAGSMVTSSVPSRTVVAGNPARVIRQLEASDGYVRP